jgi:2-oxoglutarate dehydrogenase complex dehydrogenase (E1) component-like enzyme
MMSVENETTSSTTSETDTTETLTETKAPESLVNETAETKTEETKTEETKVEETKVEPLTVESLTLPEGFELQPEMASEFLEILNGDQSPQDRANALIALHGKTLTEASEASSKLWEEMQTTWKDEVKADPDIGGAKLQPAITNIQKLIDEYGTSDLKDVFALTGAGNNIHIIKFLNKVANVLTEGKLFTAGSPAGANDPDAVAKRLFPSMKG